MHLRVLRYGAVVGVLCLAAATLAAATAKVKLELEASDGAAPRGGTLALDVLAFIDSGWHIHSNEPTDPFLIATHLTLTLPSGVEAEAVHYPPPLERVFAFAGDKKLLVYEGKLGLAVAIRMPADYSGETLHVEAVLRYQACNDTTCLPPATAHGSLDVPVTEAVGAEAPGAEGGHGQAGRSGRGDGSRFAGWLSERGLVFTLLAVTLLGLGLNLTPCVYPLISVTIAYFGGQTHGRGRVAWLASLYVLGIAVSFSALGTAAALSGGLFGAALQNPAVILFITAVLVGLSLSSFGVYQFQPPTALLRWAGGSASGAAGAMFMGLTMGVVAAPCVGPIVIGLLLFVGSQQDLFLGFLLFFFLALGMGAPYLALAMVAGSLQRLPRSGEWLLWTERLFGCILLCLAAYFVSPLLPQPLGRWALPAFVAVAGLYLGFLEPAGRALRYFPAVKRLVGILMVLFAVWLIAPAGAPSAVAWEPIDALENEGQALDAGQPVLIDFAAEWCIPCREMDHTTYVDAEVVREAERFRMFKADITEESEQTSQLVERYDVRGVPTVILFSAMGDERERFVGYVGAEELLGAMRVVP